MSRTGKDTMLYISSEHRAYLKAQGVESCKIKAKAGIKVKPSESEGIRYLIEKDKKGDK